MERKISTSEIQSVHHLKDYLGGPVSEEVKKSSEELMAERNAVYMKAGELAFQLRAYPQVLEGFFKQISDLNLAMDTSNKEPKMEIVK